MAEPTPAFDLIIKHGIRPRLEYLGGLVGELLGRPPSDDLVMKCIGSIQSQLLFCLNPGVARVYPKFNLTPPTIDELADHIAAFSLGRHPRAQPSSAAVPSAARASGGAAAS